MSRLVIFGAGGHGKVVADIARCMGTEVAAFVDPGMPDATVLGAPVYREWEDLAARAEGTRDLMGVVALGDNAKRKRVVENILRFAPAMSFAILVHPAATLAADVSLGAGTVVMAGATINAAAVIGAHAIVNTNASVDHDCRFGDFVSIGPGAVLGGNVTVGRHSAIAIGAVLSHGISIGENTIIGAASLVLKDVPPNVTAYGVPCRTVRPRQFGDTYL